MDGNYFLFCFSSIAIYQFEKLLYNYMYLKKFSRIKKERKYNLLVRGCTLSSRNT